MLLWLICKTPRNGCLAEALPGASEPKRRGKAHVASSAVAPGWPLPADLCYMPFVSNGACTGCLAKALLGAVEPRRFGAAAQRHCLPGPSSIISRVAYSCL
jgi:hypothetical protein